jgi:hypothetical protein
MLTNETKEYLTACKNHIALNIFTRVARAFIRFLRPLARLQVGGLEEGVQVLYAASDTARRLRQEEADVGNCE